MKKLILILTVGTLLGSCGGGNDKRSKVKLDGSSTIYPISEAVAEEFQEENEEVNVTIGVSGTGGGFKKFIRKEIDITGASRPINKLEDADANTQGVSYIELPVAYDGLAIVVNPQNTWVNKITVAELKKLWEPASQGKITKWNQIRPEWPNEKINLYGPATESGTFDYFTEAIVGESKASRGDYTASEDDNVLVQGISTDKYGLGYFGLAYYEENQDKLKLVPVDDENESNGAGAIAASQESVLNGTYQPLSRPLFIYVNTESANQPAVDKFVKYFITSASELVPETGFIPLKQETYDLVMKRYQDRKTGSLFLEVSTVGIKLDEVLKSVE
ncbi:MAG TPA: PstS family phosphate ABC transporter substrate-binding protein [Cytophagaceae bacterium]